MSSEKGVGGKQSGMGFVSNIGEKGKAAEKKEPELALWARTAKKPD